MAKCYYFSQVDFWSDIPHCQRHLVANCVTTSVRLTFGQTYPLGEKFLAKCVTTSVRLTSGQTYPPGRDTFWPSVTTSVRLTLGKKCPLPQLGFGSGGHLVRLMVRLTFGQTYPLAETSCGQVCYYFSQVDLWSDILPSRDIFWPSVTTSVRLTFGQAYPPMIKLWVRLTFSQASGQADLWSDIPKSPPFAETSCGQVCY